MVVASRKFGRNYRTYRVLNPGPDMCESITLSARAQLFLWTKRLFARPWRTITSAWTMTSMGPLHPQSVGPLCPRDHYVRKVRDFYVRETIPSAKYGTIVSAGSLRPKSAGSWRPRDHYVRKVRVMTSAGPLRPKSAGSWRPRDHYVRKVWGHGVRGTITSTKFESITSPGPLSLQSVGPLFPRDHNARKVRENHIGRERAYDTVATY